MAGRIVIAEKSLKNLQAYSLQIFFTNSFLATV